jgi:DNA repair exonuclease SbcCD nuclease subunit
MKFAHTADWQIGMKCQTAGAGADDVRNVRLETIRRVVDAANEHAVDFMLVAGDLFDNQTPRAAELGAVVEALKASRAPVFVLPGNHDPAGPRGPFASPIWANLAGTTVTTIEKPGVFPIPGGELLATPCETKFGTTDPTQWFATHESTPSKIRIGLAHGSLRLGEIGKTRAGDIRGHFPIDASAAERGRLEYLALGDWHGFLEHRNGKAVISYSGTPEQTSFKDENSGTISIVTIDAPGSAPSIERVPVGKLRWTSREYEVCDDASIGRINSDLFAIPQPRQTLVRATLRGLCAPSAAEQLRAFEPAFRARFLSFEMLHQYVPRPETEGQWLALVPPGEFVELVKSLIADIGTEREAVSMCALDKLAELAR